MFSFCRNKDKRRKQVQKTLETISFVPMHCPMCFSLNTDCDENGYRMCYDCSYIWNEDEI